MSGQLLTQMLEEYHERDIDDVDAFLKRYTSKLQMSERSLLDTIAATISEVRMNIESRPSQWHSDSITALEALVNRMAVELADCVDDFDSERFHQIALTDDWERYLS